ncbi:MAG TPA: hypothetical protein VMX97_03365 [Hyphomicrobiaceae bacterium]|nr:hypothetical protein [Hyphomicrobiaceae bacterium]
MISLAAVIATFLLASPAWAVIEFDAVSEGEGTSTFQWDHVPVGTVKGLFVFVDENADSGDVISGVTADGTAMDRINYAVDADDEPGQQWGYFLGASIPAGTLTIIVTVSSGTTDKHGKAVSVTAASDTELAGTTGTCKVEGDTANPGCTVTGISGASFAASGLHSGLNAEVSVSAGTGMTLGPALDYGTDLSTSEYSTIQQAGGDHTVAYVAGADDVAMIVIAIQQTVPDAAVTPQVTIISRLIPQHSPLTDWSTNK